MLSSVVSSIFSKIQAFRPQLVSLRADYNKSQAILAALESSSSHRSSPFPRQDLLSSPRRRLPRSESLHLLRTSESLWRSGPTVAISFLPFVGYPLLACSFLLAPQYTLSSNFWTKEEEERYGREAVARMERFGGKVGESLSLSEANSEEGVGRAFEVVREIEREGGTVEGESSAGEVFEGFPFFSL